MTALENEVARHYARGSLYEAILDGLKAMGLSLDRVVPADLAGIDEFHMGGREATSDLAAQLHLRPGMALLDIGCGIGGPARFFASEHGCRVTGIDLTPDYVEVATALTRLVGLADRIEYRVGSALDLPFAPESFDRATMLHVGMNIADKERLCAEARRVLRPDGLFAIYDVMRTGDGDIAFPVPWAASEATSFVATPEAYRQALTRAGFVVAAERSRRDLAVEFFRRMQARIATSGPPPLGLHVVMGQDAPAKVANTVAALEQGRIAPVEMIARR